ncbi:MAG: hypothetical protein ACXWWN_10355, partial [Gemmatimonadales bacterium]
MNKSKISGNRVLVRRVWMIVAAILLTSHFSPLTLSPLTVSPLTAQNWNSPATRALVERAVERRRAVEADSTLRSYRARAHGFVFFLAQVGEGLAEPPRLVKAD